MGTEKKVTIVIPVFNGENYIRDAIDSALAQTYKNIEILVINDGSTDETEKIVKSYGNKIRYIRKKNGGVSSALNLAIKKMTGDYFSWLSHDDTYEPDKIETEIEYLKKFKLLDKKVILFSDYYLIDKKGKTIGKSEKNEMEILKKPEYIFLKGHINGLSLLIPKAAFNEYGGFDEKMVCVQDYVMWKKMSKTYKFVHIPKKLVSTRWHNKQVTQTSPKVEEEGNKFYFDAIAEVHKKRREELEGSEYCFYLELSKFYKNSAYSKVGKYCEEKAQEIFNNTSVDSLDKKVSVIIPFYNRIQETIRAIDSVLRQTYQNFEIILVDDGSTEDITEIKKKINKNEKIKIVRNKNNAGASAARNMGIIQASGDYLVFLDSDDEFLPNKIETQLKYAVISNAKMLHTSYIRRKSDNEDVVHSGKDDGHCEGKLMYSCQIATPTVMLDAKWLKTEGILFDTTKTIGEDVCFWLEIMKRGIYLLGIDEALSIINVGKNAAAYSDEKQLSGIKQILEYILTSDYYNKKDYGIAKLMESYLYFYKKNNNDFDIMLEDGKIKKIIFFLKQEGIKSTTKRVLKKIKILS